MINDTKKIIKPILILLCLASVFTFQSCKKSRSDMGKTLYLKTKNKVFKDVTPEGFAQVFQKVLADEQSKMTNPQLITSYYENNGYDPVFVMDHIITNDLDATYFKNAGDHGLNPKIFQADEIAGLITKINAKKSIKTLDEAYHDIAELEMLTANALINYSNAMQYGVVNPKKIYNRYYIETKTPDTATINHIFQVARFKTYLDSIQPKDPQYITLQKALKQGVQAPGMSAEETKRIITVNLERLRWKNKPAAEKYVVVNIPDYRLDVMENGKSVLNMKVCVGQGRNM
ncbi:MAG: L,D-transpeptidase, partial [Mucilaginibacter sp.]